MRFNRLCRWRALLLCRLENHAEDHIYTSYDESIGNESISSKDTNSHSSSSDGGTSSNDQSWMSNESNVYDQICYDSIRSNATANTPLKHENPLPPYLPAYSPEEPFSEHYYYRLPTPTCLIPNEILPSKTSILPQPDQTKKELHKELIHRQKMGQLLPKQPELLHVFKQRRVEEKKRADEQMREQSKLEEILARQRQKLDRTENLCSISSNESAYSNEFEFVFHRIRQQQKRKE